ncbi:hypothetical protein EBX93_17755 [bacterium]|nr:hypothetical protein [bacterium]
MIYIKENDGEDEIYSHSAKIRTVSEDASKPERTLTQPGHPNKQKARHYCRASHETFISK